MSSLEAIAGPLARLRVDGPEEPAASLLEALIAYRARLTLDYGAPSLPFYPTSRDALRECPELISWHLENLKNLPVRAAHPSILPHLLTQLLEAHQLISEYQEPAYHWSTIDRMIELAYPLKNSL